jgi:hypothetical protein
MAISGIFMEQPGKTMNFYLNKYKGIGLRELKKVDSLNNRFATNRFLRYAPGLCSEGLYL